ncbi:MAG TPA: GGDEF domain-containing protein [Candidatus Acidoferrum sp.]|nr:GGDEF domain-containing protein [Candidatus Acidoferrum sp.]
MIQDNDAHKLLAGYVDDLCRGLTPRPLPAPADFPQDMRALAESLSLLGGGLAAAARLARQLTRGELADEAPEGKSGLAADLIDLRANLTALSWGMKQLAQGGLAAKIFAPGELYANFNTLLSRLSPAPSSADDPAHQWSRAVNSWRYTQIVSAMNQLHIMMLEVDAEGNVLYANPPFKSAFPELMRISYAAGGAQTREGHALMDYLATFGEFGPLLSPDAPATDRFPVGRELYDEGADAWYKVTTDRIKLVGGAYGLLHMIDDISEWKKHETKLRESATIDALTGAYTRGAGLAALNEAYADRGVSHTCVAFADIDGLKTINDTFGHAEGDFTIRAVADVFLSCVRKSDWVIRYGGDEFVIIFRDCTLESAAAAIARMHEKLEEQNAALKKPYRLSFSIGYTLIEKRHLSVEELLAEVDEMMYEKKRIHRPVV